jgi:N-acetylglucosamine-6-phosphate deacetylase
MLLRGRHYQTGDQIDVVCQNDRIHSISPATTESPTYQAGWIAPALFDLQINGCDGRSFNSPALTSNDVRHVTASCHRHGIGAFCPTLVTNSFTVLEHGMRTLCRAFDDDSSLACAIPGIHLEGPYISAEDGPRGAHPRQHVRPPDEAEFRHLQDASGGRIRLVTLAPELDGALSFIEKLTAAGVIVAIGHTAATPTVIRDAVRAGARLSTHLGNGSHALLPRHDNYLWEQLADDRLWASIICDGHHLPDAVIRCILRVKTPARLLLTCDASSLAGLPPGRYREWEQDFDVQAGGKIVVAGTPYLAGSGVFTDHCVGHVLRFSGVTLADALDMASARPRELLGLPERRLQVGEVADLVLFDWQPGGAFRVVATVLAGQKVVDGVEMRGLEPLTS